MKVILPGSYDPVTLGHLDVIRRASEMYEEVYAVVFINPEKSYTFSLDDRVSMLMLATEGLDNVLVSYSLGRVVDYMREHGLQKIVKMKQLIIWKLNVVLVLKQQVNIMVMFMLTVNK